MNRQEFVDRLRVSLSGRISPTLVEENARYYEDYINTQIRLGETEENVLDGLGDPRLIARSIIAAADDRAGAGTGEQTYAGSMESEESRGRMRRFIHFSNLPPWAMPVMAGGIFLLVLVALGLIFRLVLHMLAWLWPLIAIGMIVLFFIKLFRDWLH